MRAPRWRRRQATSNRRRVGLLLAVVAAIAGGVLLGVAVAAQRSPARPSATAAGSIAAVPLPAAHAIPSSTGAPLGRSVSSPTPAADLPRSVPTGLTIPSIGVHSALVQLGENADQTIEVPTSYHLAGWYAGSVSPGQVGPTVILGHVDSHSGPGVFFRLGALQPGAIVTLTRTDGRTVSYRITGVRQYSKNSFPTWAVYANTPVPAIRLITCGGEFDSVSGHYLSNIIAFGQLAAS